MLTEGRIVKDRSTKQNIPQRWRAKYTQRLRSLVAFCILPLFLGASNGPAHMLNNQVNNQMPNQASHTALPTQPETPIHPAAAFCTEHNSPIPFVQHQITLIRNLERLCAELYGTAHPLIPDLDFVKTAIYYYAMHYERAQTMIESRTLVADLHPVLATLGTEMEHVLKAYQPVIHELLETDHINPEAPEQEAEQRANRGIEIPEAESRAFTLPNFSAPSISLPVLPHKPAIQNNSIPAAPQISPAPTAAPVQPEAALSHFFKTVRSSYNHISNYPGFYQNMPPGHKYGGTYKKKTKPKEDLIRFGGALAGAGALFLIVRHFITADIRAFERNSTRLGEKYDELAVRIKEIEDRTRMVRGLEPIDRTPQEKPAEDKTGAKS